MTSFSIVGVCVFDAPPPNAPRGNSYAHYIAELLSHAGLAHRFIKPAELESVLPEFHLLVTVGEAELSDDAKTRLQSWCEAGGAWLSIAGTCGLPELFGVENAPPAYSFAQPGPAHSTMGEGYLHAANEAHPILGHLEIPLHFFNGFAVRKTDGETLATASNAHQHPSSHCGMMEKKIGDGHCLLIAPDVIGAIVRIQQGVAITRDGSPAPDGSAAVSDGVLKCDDGLVLDWHFDRQSVPQAPGLQAFLFPIADAWRELVLRAIFHLASKQKIALALLWLYPRNLPALAHMSFDSDGNDPVLAKRLLEVLDEAGIATTWCIILPGYEPELINQIREAGHELAMHYDALDHPWSEEDFDEQWQALCEQFSAKPVSNKNHYTRWEGDTEFLDWCQKRGIQLDQSKGPSKTGEIGFLFGTCHTYFSVAPDGRLIDVLELPFFTQDLEIFAPSIVREVLRAAVLRANGVLHMLFHPAHIETPGVAKALLDTVRESKNAGMEWWTAQAINDWERARRSVQWQSNENALTLRAEQTLEGATLLFLQSENAPLSINGAPVETQTVRRWGFDFQMAVLNLAAQTDFVIKNCT